MHYRSFCVGESKTTNTLRELLSSLLAGAVPRSWCAAYNVKSSMALSAWVLDLSERVRALERYRPILDGHVAAGGAGVVYWMGGMFSAESFITANRQFTAQVCFHDHWVCMFYLLM